MPSPTLVSSGILAMVLQHIDAILKDIGHSPLIMGVTSVA